MRIVKIQLIGCFFFIVGCTVIAPYVAPTGPNVAKIRFQAPDSEWQIVGVYTYSSERCTNPAFIISLEDIKNTTQKNEWNVKYLKPTITNKLGMYDPPFIYDNLYHEEIIPAGKKFNFSMVSPVGSTQCDITMSFTPLSGKQYEARYDQSGFMCRVSIFELTMNNSGKVARIPVADIEKNHRECSKQL